jgi:lipopolysaccharide transport system ATP-binding protein
MKPVIEINQLGKKYRIRKTEPYLSLRDAITDSVKTVFRKREDTKKDFWALQDINLNISAGERVGIIGRNGAGKSTLLKILSRISLPTTGHAIVRGRLSSLLEVGTGFHPELTGRENIYLNGSILGLKKAEISKQFDAIVDFSGVAPFLETPLKNYSSGMQLRLAFAVAAHLEPEVLLIDEVLAVGDMEFQKKCLGKMEEVSRQHGRTILFVSHNMNQLKHLCNTAVLLDQGKISFYGDTADAIKKYSESIYIHKNYIWQNNDAAKEFSLTEVAMKNKNGIISRPVKAGEDFFIEISIAARQSISNSIISVRFTNQENVPVYTTTNADKELHFTNITAGKHRYRIPVPVNLFLPGRYSIIVSWSIPNVEELDKIENELLLDIEDELYAGAFLKDGRLGIINKTIYWEKI